MIQLGYYPAQNQQDESLDFDPNYDPSDFLLKKDSTSQEPMQQYQQESFEYSSGIQIQEGAGGDEINMQQSYYSSFSGQQDYSFQSQSTQEEYSQPQLNVGGGLADLEISDSDDDDDDENNTSGNQANTSKDEGELWF